MNNKKREKAIRSNRCWKWAVFFHHDRSNGYIVCMSPLRGNILLKGKALKVYRRYKKLMSVNKNGWITCTQFA
ncbi:hypothetical protein A0U40_08870 [[Bacillus] sp. KCTC 13219]|nr:hypothetical protein A0U40_08870 [[Bacillus] sp. KCTC 13219]